MLVIICGHYLPNTSAKVRKLFDICKFSCSNNQARQLVLRLINGIFLLVGQIPFLVGYRRFEAAEKVLSGSPKILIFGESGGDSAPHDAERHQ